MRAIILLARFPHSDFVSGVTLAHPVFVRFCAPVPAAFLAVGGHRSAILVVTLGCSQWSRVSRSKSWFLVALWEGFPFAGSPHSGNFQVRVPPRVAAQEETSTWWSPPALLENPLAPSTGRARAQLLTWQLSRVLCTRWEPGHTLDLCRVISGAPALSLLRKIRLFPLASLAIGASCCSPVALLLLHAISGAAIVWWRHHSDCVG